MGIFAILARNDALFVLDPLPAAGFLRALTRPLVRNGDGRPGERLARALREAGPAFIKLGQALSTRSDLLGEDLAADLSDLQDRLPPFPAEAARSIIAREFGRPVEHLFAEFDDTPVAAASIAQVHFAVDTDGRMVAVKVLRPGVEDDFRRHLDLFAWVAERIEAGMAAVAAVAAAGVDPDSRRECPHRDGPAL